jgi:hypothetical protein
VPRIEPSHSHFRRGKGGDLETSFRLVFEPRERVGGEKREKRALPLRFGAGRGPRKGDGPSSRV